MLFLWLPEEASFTLRGFHGFESGRMASKMRWNTYGKDHCADGTSGNGKVDLLDYTVICEVLCSKMNLIGSLFCKKSRWEAN